MLYLALSQSPISYYEGLFGTVVLRPILGLIRTSPAQSRNKNPKRGGIMIQCMSKHVEDKGFKTAYASRPPYSRLVTHTLYIRSYVVKFTPFSLFLRIETFAVSLARRLRKFVYSISFLICICPPFTFAVSSFFCQIRFSFTAKQASIFCHRFLTG